ncbi:MAG: oxygenase MpaB family protein [Actinomycetota bacterium]|nr:oxygenase MpaB family protein [Actinomycetota bacterium]
MDGSDLGLFGPRSVSWRLHQDRSAFVGGVRALLLQALSTRSMRAVVDFSDYRSDPWGRFFRTSDFIMTVTYAPTERALAAIEKVRRVHERIQGFDPDSGQPYAAGDPELLAFIHNCFVDSILAAYTGLVRPLYDAEADLYLAEQAEVALRLGARKGALATSRAELAPLIEGVGDLGISEGARRAFADISSPRFGDLAPVLEPLWRLLFETAVDLLPPFALELYGLDPWRPLAPLRRVSAAGLAQAARLLLPSHPYVRRAKYAWYSTPESLRS